MNPKSRRLNFRIYRVGTSKNLLSGVKSFLDEDEDVREDFHYLNGAIFFSTQKNMAMEYNIDSKSILLTVSGVNFLNAATSAGVKLILLENADIPTYQRIVAGSIKTSEEIKNFFNKRCYDANKVSLSTLRKACEIMVLLPDGYSQFDIRGAKIQSIYCRSERTKKHGKYYTWDGMTECGGYHDKKLLLTQKADTKYRKYVRQLKKLRKKRDDLIYQAAKKGEISKEAHKIEDQILALKEKMHERRKFLWLDNLSFFAMPDREISEEHKEEENSEGWEDNWEDSLEEK